MWNVVIKTGTSAIKGQYVRGGLTDAVFRTQVPDEGISTGLPDLLDIEHVSHFEQILHTVCNYLYLACVHEVHHLERGCMLGHVFVMGGGLHWETSVGWSISFKIAIDLKLMRSGPFFKLTNRWSST